MKRVQMTLGAPAQKNVVQVGKRGGIIVGQHDAVPVFLRKPGARGAVLGGENETPNLEWFGSAMHPLFPRHISRTR